MSEQILIEKKTIHTYCVINLLVQLLDVRISIICYFIFVGHIFHRYRVNIPYSSSHNIFFFFNCDAANLCAIRHPRPYNQSIISYILTWTIKWCRRATAELINTINNAQIFSNIFSLFTLNETLANIRIFSSFDCLLSFNIHVFLLFTFYNVFVNQFVCLWNQPEYAIGLHGYMLPQWAF